MAENDNFRKCESCGKNFDCGASGGECWCFEIPVDADTRGVIAGRFDDCLCPECLLKYSKSQTK